MTWNPAQYLKFAGHRLRPALDLLSRIEDEQPGRVVDLGCGAGNVTKALASRWTEAEITGVDTSPEMLEKARGELPGVNWIEGSAENWTADAPVDVVYSNAALHWLGGHDTLFPHLVAQLAPGGTLAVQMPRNFAEPSHVSVEEAARQGPWRSTIEPMLQPAPVSVPDFYWRLLDPLVTELDIWETQYLQALEGENAVAEWTKGTWLKPFLDALEGDERDGFEAVYRDLVAKAYPRGPDGKTLFPFRRLFIVAKV